MQQNESDIIFTLVASTALMLAMGVFFVLLVLRYQSRLQRKQNELFTSVLQAQEEERSRLASDLHDGLGGTLAMVRGFLAESKAGSEHPEDLYENIERSYDLVLQAINDAKDVSNALLPAVIRKFGLGGAINDLRRQYEDRLEVELDNRCPEKLPMLLQGHVYRILSELFLNGLKYSGSQRFTLAIWQEEHELCIDFNDNGKGFDFNKLMGAGNGLKNINDRVKVLNGRLYFSNKMGGLYRFRFKTALPHER